MQQPLLSLDTGAEVRLRRAREIHLRERGADSSFGHLDFGKFPADLHQAVLFGYRSGAGRGRINGHVQSAVGGTCFLDNINEADEGALRTLALFLETGTFYRLGDTQSDSSDARIIVGAASMAPPVAQIAERLHARIS